MRRLAAALVLGLVSVGLAWSGVRAHAATTSPVLSTPTRGSQLYATNFDPSTFNQDVVGSSASLTQGSGPSLVCGVGSAGSKMIATVKNWSVTEPTSIWAEYDVNLDQMSGQLVASFYFEGTGGNHRHLHIDFAANQITLRDPNYNNEGQLVSVPSLSSGATVHFVVIDTSPRYRVYVNGTQVIDYTDSFPASTPADPGLDCASQNNGTGSDSVTNFAIYNVSGACAANWTCGDIGNPTPTGTEVQNGSTWTIQGGGNDIWGTSDQFHYVWQTLPASAAMVTARVTSQTDSSSWAKAGVMLRSTTDPGSPDYSLFVTPGNGMVVQYRSTQGGSAAMAVQQSGSVPAYVGVGYNGTAFTAYTSTDGSTWTAIAKSAETINVNGTLVGGLAVTSHNASALSSVAVDSASTGSVCPSPWTCADIGAPTPAGAQSLSGSTWTISAGGSDIQGTSDQFRYVWQTLGGDGSVSAQITSQSNSNGWAKAGVMLRATSAANSPYYALFVTPSNGVTMQYRSASGGSTSDIVVSGSVPAYLQVTRSGTAFSAWTSSNGTSWTAIANSTVTLANLTGSLLAGVAVTSHNSGQLSTVTADTVTISDAQSACPSGWTCADVGSPAVAGSQSLSGSTWSITGGGTDIQGAVDQFHFAWTTLAANGSISAHVTTQSNTNAWAKAGVMLRASSAAGAAYYAVFVTPGNGLAVQYRTATNGGTTAISAGSGTVPVYLEVTRSGTTFTAYSSSNGSTWSALPGSTTISALTGSLLEGMAVCSHTSSAASTATMDSVTAS